VPSSLFGGTFRRLSDSVKPEYHIFPDIHIMASCFGISSIIWSILQIQPSVKNANRNLAIFTLNRKQAAPWTARHFFAQKLGKFSKENLRVKIARTQFLPAFQGRSKLRCENRLSPPLLTQRVPRPSNRG